MTDHLAQMERPMISPAPEASSHKHPSLERVLGYENADVIYSFMTNFEISRSESEDIFREMLRYLWLCFEVRRKGIRTEISIDQPLRIIDEMWHSFILHTAEYRRFCTDVFGEFQDHQPLTVGMQSAFEQKRDSVSVESKTSWLVDRKRPAYRLVYEHLGPEIFRRWYFEFGSLYSPSRLLELRKR